MNRRIELVYDADCPNVAEARAALLRACAKTGVAAAWVEWERNVPKTPAHVRGYGSPTILIDGKDIAGAGPHQAADCCRLYTHAEHVLRGAPPVEQIAAALTARPKAQTRRGAAILTLPGIGALLLPIGACPACWPAYAGLLASLGLGFLLDASYLLPVALTLLVLALLPLVESAWSGSEYRPLALAVLGVGLALAGKFAFSADLLLYLGIASLVGASLWNSWREKRAAGGACTECAPHVPEAKG